MHEKLARRFSLSYKFSLDSLSPNYYRFRADASVMKQGARAYPPNQWAAINDNERGLTLEIDSYQKSISDYAFEKIYFLHVKKIWKTFNDDLPRFHNLIKFYASSIPLLKIPTSLCYLRHLKTLSVRSCALDSLPSELAQMKSLNTLDIARNNFSTLPEVICGIRTLHVLIACSCGITRLPDWLIHSSIKCLQIDDNYITVLPASYFLIYWMHPPVQRYTTDDCQVLILLANPLMTSPKTSKQNIEPFLCKNSDVVPSLVRLAANVCAALIPNIAKRSETLPQELRELFSRNMRECDRCRKKFAFPFKVIRFQSWQVRRSTLFLRKENK